MPPDTLQYALTGFADANPDSFDMWLAAPYFQMRQLVGVVEG